MVKVVNIDFSAGRLRVTVDAQGRTRVAVVEQTRLALGQTGEDKIVKFIVLCWYYWALLSSTISCFNILLINI